MGKLNNVTLFGIGLFFVTWVLASLTVTQRQEAPIDVECKDLSEVIKKPEDLKAEDKQHVLASLMASASSSSYSSTPAPTPAAAADPAKDKYMEESVKHFACDDRSSGGALESRINDFVKPSGSKYPCQYLGCGRKDYIAVTFKCKKETGTADVDADMGNVELKCTGSTTRGDMNTATFAISMITSLVAIGLCIAGCKQGAAGCKQGAEDRATVQPQTVKVCVSPKADTVGSDTPVQPFVPA